MDEIEKNPLQVAYNRALDGAGGRDAANEVCHAHGASAGLHPWRRIPAGKQKAALAALEKLAGGRTKPHPAAVRSFESVRREAFARIGTTEREPAKPTAKLDPKAIFERWNNPPPVED